MQKENLRRYAFPKLRRISFGAFSLYGLQPNISIELKDGVTCLAGANGIGKSTFLATVNYGLTGAVPHPRRRLLSNQNYLKESSDYAAEYFNGRIAESDRDDAAVTLEFDIATKRFEVTRGLFDPNDFRKFTINGSSVDNKGSSPTPLQMADLYRQSVTDAIGLKSFEQFVFLQHFVFTFDEARHLLFWDDAAAAQVLFLCFGGNPEDAVRADTLNREAEKAGSRGRNTQFQVNQTRRRIEILQQSLQADTTVVSPVDLDAQYEGITEAITLTSERSARIAAQLSELEVHIAQRSSNVASLRSAYTEAFNRFLHGASKARSHSLVIRALNEGVCGVCDSSGTHVTALVQQKVDAGVCPMCGSPIDNTGDLSASGKAELADIDQRLSIARLELDDAIASQDRLRRELEGVKVEVVAAREALEKFEKEHSEIVQVLKTRHESQSNPLAQTIQNLQLAMAEFTAQRDADYAERDQIRTELKKLQQDLEVRYARAEESFLPRFRELAELFLGIDLDVQLKLTAPVGMKLLVELRGNARHDESQMSESQRFFVDIALRMALAQQMSVSSSPATLFVDTPEGSLDIAYEDRAGDMFAQFVQSGHDLIMTANINSSKLLTTLGKRCGRKHMTLNQMIGWAELSDVQQSATRLFESAYKDISKALDLGPAAVN